MSKLDHAASLISSDAAAKQKATLQQRTTNRKSINTGYNGLFLRRKVAMVVLMFCVMMAVAGAKEPQIAGRAAIRVLKQHMVKEPIFEAASSRSKELFTAAIGPTRDLNLRIV